MAGKLKARQKVSIGFEKICFEMEPGWAGAARHVGNFWGSGRDPQATAAPIKGRS
jgi:hypothetical protein